MAMATATESYTIECNSIELSAVAVTPDRLFLVGIGAVQRSNSTPGPHMFRIETRLVLYSMQKKTEIEYVPLFFIHCACLTLVVPFLYLRMPHISRPPGTYREGMGLSSLLAVMT